MRTVIIPLVGNSSRFFNAGYSSVKYKLPLSKSKSILWHILSYIDRQFKIIIITNIKFNDTDWLDNILTDLNFVNYEVIQSEDTDGQLTTVKFGLTKSKIIHNSDELIIYNGDTVRHLPYSFDFKGFDGLIEVFEQKGNHWSFVDNLGVVNKVTEKNKISKYCSTGLYAFKNINIFIKYADQAETINGEKYIAPLYNSLIADGLKINSFLSSNNNFSLCGTPTEYEINKFF